VVRQYFDAALVTCYTEVPMKKFDRGVEPVDFRPLGF
jgi:hypothetical protein